MLQCFNAFVLRLMRFRSQGWPSASVRIEDVAEVARPREVAEAAAVAPKVEERVREAVPATSVAALCR